MPKQRSLKMKLYSWKNNIFFYIHKTVLFLHLFKNLLNNIDKALTSIFCINKDINPVNSNKNIKFFGKNLVNIVLEFN